MTGLRQGAFRIFTIAGINVYLHWSWFVVALIEINARQRSYSSPIWNGFEYLALFAIVTTHEFGHALACRQVGGSANQIVLWPLGGVAYVDPPQRPGAVLWSIAAGPLVNVALLPVLAGLYGLGNSLGWAFTLPDVHEFLWFVMLTNIGLLVFNLLPIYPLDGGKILWALLWFPLGRARSLMVSVVVGFIGMIGFVAYGISKQYVWFYILAAFMFLNCWSGLAQARVLLRMAKLPRRQELSCPACKSSPPIGDYWICGQCRKPFDTFQLQSVCPNCGARFSMTRCLDCGRLSPMNDWARPAVAARLG